MFWLLPVCNSSAVMVRAAPVKLFFAWLKYPVTTTSSSSVASSFITTLISVRVPTFTSCVSIPTIENNNT